MASLQASPAPRGAVYCLSRRGRADGERPVVRGHPVQAIGEVSRDITGRSLLRLAGGRQLSALGIQREYLARARDFTDTRGADAVSRRLLGMWERALDATGTQNLGAIPRSRRGCGADSVRPMGPAAEELTGHPDRERWNSRYSGGFSASFTPHPLAVRALSLDLPPGPVADLACGPSGSALLAAGAGRRVTAVDVSEVALALLGEQARRRHLDHLITLVHADLAAWRPAGEGYALVLCTGYWDRALLDVAAGAVRPGGLLGWEAFTTGALRDRPGMNPGWCLGPGEPASLLPADFRVLDTEDVPGHGTRRRLLARRLAGTPDASP